MTPERSSIALQCLPSPISRQRYRCPLVPSSGFDQSPTVSCVLPPWPLLAAPGKASVMSDTVLHGVLHTAYTGKRNVCSPTFPTSLAGSDSPTRMQVRNCDVLHTPCARTGAAESLITYISSLLGFQAYSANHLLFAVTNRFVRILHFAL